MSSSSLVGRSVDRYDVVAQLGQGGFGAVYRARHQIVGNEVALKVLWPDHAADPQKVERFLQEARAAAAVGSEHIVRVFDAGLTPDGVAFLALELLEGRDLEDELRARETLPLEEAVAVVAEILEGLDAAHAAGIVHRDLKPGNVFLARAERGRRVKILDFGISKIVGQKTLTAAGTILGTPQYMAPEQLSGDRLDHRADLYAAGTILYELLSGRVPFEGAGYEVLVERVQGRRPPDLRSLAPSVPPAVADVAMRALALDPDARWPDARSMQAALRAALGRDDVPRIASAPTLPSVPKPSRPPASTPALPSIRPAPPSSPWPVAALAGLAVLLAAGLGVLGVLGYRLWTRPAAAPPAPVTTNAIPVEVPPDVSGPVPVSVPVPVPIPGEAPASAPAAPATWEILSYAGTGSRFEVEDMLTRALANPDRCRGDRTLQLIVNVVISGSAVRVAQHDPSRRSDDTRAADCVGEVIRRHGSVPFGDAESAVVTLRVVLPPRGSPL